MTTPAHVTEALDAATAKKLEKRGERDVRALMEAILASVREGRDAALKAKDEQEWGEEQRIEERTEEVEFL